MSELSNPLFDNQREFLERQKEEYKNALMGDVEQIKSQGQEVGKKVAVAGGILLAGYLIRRMFGGKKKGKAVKENTSHTTYDAPVTADVNAYDSFVHEQEDEYTLASERQHPIKKKKKSAKQSKGFLKSDAAKFIKQQAVSILLVYLAKKAEELINSNSENNDIAASPAPVVVTEPETTTLIVPDPNAL
ncbi:hypothetical protein [Pontibacter arcticus]|uniref:Uncharacterized protein n=1 Tax=Pontibacter arcticus TaxID=2080288 RepID=A0A364RIX7_9BACT|nr:hypothetical protein [Pontibacter arcticus]RAU84198.1 hypothetical protein DP923_03915 [Pontibacter arcticus]